MSTVKSLSRFRQKNKEIIGQHIEELIAHETQIDESDQNFQIAKKFIWNKLENNNFPDTNETLVARNIRDIQQKFVYISQDGHAERLKYLVNSFLERKTFKQVGISDTHMSILHLLLCLSANPTGSGVFNGQNTIQYSKNEVNQQNFGFGGIFDCLSLVTSKQYEGKEEIDRQNQEVLENHLKQLDQSEEMNQIKMVKKQWERELLEEEGDDSFSSLSESDDNQEQIQDNQNSNQIDAKMEPVFPEKKQYKKQKVQLFKNQAILYGGLPAD